MGEGSQGLEQMDVAPESSCSQEWECGLDVKSGFAAWLPWGPE